MNDINKIYFKNYKCFSSLNVIENIKPINIIIGKNNIGKSSLLDVIEMINDSNKLSSYRQMQLYINTNITKDDIGKVFQIGHSSSDIPGNDNYEFGQRYIGKSFTYALSSNMLRDLSSSIFKKHFVKENGFNNEFNEKYSSYWSNLASVLIHQTKTCKRIYPERNIYSELEKDKKKVDGNGGGITTIIKNFLNKSNLDENKVKHDLLNKLNEIIGCDAHFFEITTQQINKENEEVEWEIFLVEDNKGRIALSQSGSGLKTILMILVYTILIPDIEKNDLSSYIFLFEELENNLHPSLERRLLKYIEELADAGATIFLSTHSNVVLDGFQNSDKSQIYHILKEGDTINIKNVTDLMGKQNCLDDIGIKASDILQSNGIIWVEGPSDRIYINKWIELWTQGKYKEGMHYQCLFYGGKLASYLTIDHDLNELINLLNVNKNSVILIDSDKRDDTRRINKTKSRIKSEFDISGRFCWITKGKEIENYIPKEIIDSLYEKTIDEAFEQFTLIDTYLDNFLPMEGKRFKESKVKYAQKYIESMNLKNMKTSFDLNTNMNRLIREIEKWNNL